VTVSSGVAAVRLSSSVVTYCVLVAASACHSRSLTTAGDRPAGEPTVAPAVKVAVAPAALCHSSGPPRSSIAWEGGTATRELRGRVVRLRTGEPMPRALIRVEPGRHGALADSSGGFRIAGLTPGTYEVRVLHIGFVEARDSVTIGDDGLQLLAVIAVPDVGLRECVVGPKPPR
jgi:hypothetical protein